MTVATLILAGAVLLLASAVAIVGWGWMNDSRLDVLSDDEIRDNLAPKVAAELLIMASQDAPPPIEEPQP